MEYKERYQEWLSNPYFDAETKAELEGIKEDNVLLFTTDHEEYPVVPLVCDPGKENETCLISETDRDGIVFRLEQEGEQVWLCTGTDRYRRVWDA